MKIEILRKLFHLIGLIIPVIYYLLPTRLGLKLFLLITVFFLTFDILRLRIKPVKDIFISIFGSIIRQKEHTNLTGATYLLVASLLSAIFFEKIIAVAVVSYLIVGDTLAAFVGQGIGKIRIGQKTLEGFIGGLLGCIAVSLILHYLNPQELTITAGIIGAFTASIVELIPSEIFINDNIAIPIFSGAAIEFYNIMKL